MSEDVTASLGAKLPKGEANGLTPLARQMVDYPRKVRAAIILFDAPKTTLNHDEDTATVTARIRRIEVIQEAGDFAVLQRILLREFERRTGMTTLPIELEDDVKSAFADLDLNMDAIIGDLDQDDPPADSDTQEPKPDDAATLEFSDDENDPTAGPWGDDD